MNNTREKISEKDIYSITKFVIDDINVMAIYVVFTVGIICYNIYATVFNAKSFWILSMLTMFITVLSFIHFGRDMKKFGIHCKVYYFWPLFRHYVIGWIYFGVTFILSLWIIPAVSERILANISKPLPYILVCVFSTILVLITMFFGIHAFHRHANRNITL